MAHTFASLEKLEKSDLARLAMNHQNKFDTVLNNISYELLDLKNNLSQIGKFPEILIINYNPQQNIWNKTEKSSKTGQDKKSLISTFACFLTATAKV